MKSTVLLLSFLLAVTCQMFGQNPELKALFDEDQAARHGNEKITRSDDDRIKLVLELLAKDAAKTPEDKFHAALVLQHTPLGFCEKRMVSESSYNYLLAHYLAKQSYETGYKDARGLVAVTIDRYLWLTEGHQKYGTQVAINQETGKEEWVPIDRSVPDSERAKYGVSPLAELLKSHPEQKIK